MNAAQKQAALFEMRRHALELSGIAQDLAEQAGIAVGFKAGNKAAAYETIEGGLAQVRTLLAHLAEDAKTAGLPGEGGERHSEPTWFGLRLDFIGESDQDTVDVILRRIEGYTLSVRTTDGQVRDRRYKEWDISEGEIKRGALGRVVFHLLTASCELTDETESIPFEDLEAIGIY